MKKRIFSVFTTLLILALALSCSNSARFAEMGGKSFAVTEESGPVGSTEMNKDFSATAPASESPKPGSPAHGRKLVYSAEMSIEAKDISEAEAAVVNAVEKAGGYIASRSGDEYGTYLLLRLPVPELEPIMAAVKGTGRTLSRSFSAQDVTEQYFDLEGRLRTMRILEERYRDYLKKAQSIKDILEVEQKLSETTSQAELLEGSFRDLSKQIALATLTVNIRPVRSVDPSRPGFLQSVGNIFSSFGRVMGEALIVVIGVLVYGIPLVLFLALLWFVSFGRVGLLRKLFLLVRAKKTKPTA